MGEFKLVDDVAVDVDIYVEVKCGTMWLYGVESVMWMWQCVCYVEEMWHYISFAVDLGCLEDVEVWNPVIWV